MASTSKQYKVADAVAATLNAAFSATFTAVVRPVPMFRVEDLTDLKVSVAPMSMETDMSARLADGNDVMVGVGVQQRIGESADAARCDVLAKICEDILDFMHTDRRALTGYAAAKVIEGTIDPVLDPTIFREHHVFLGVVNLTYRIEDVA
jgi:hypothetical protein